MNGSLTQNNPWLVTAWRHLRHELLYISWALMEVALITPVALAFMPWARYWPPFLVATWLLLLMLLPFHLARLMALLGTPLRRQQPFMLAALLLALIVINYLLLYKQHPFFSLAWASEFYSHIAQANHPFWTRDVVLFWLLIVVWWRGAGLGGREGNLQKVGLRLRVGALILGPAIIILAHLRLQWDVTSFLLLFMMAGLTAVALTRAEEVERSRSGLSAAMNARWLGAILAAAFLLTMVAGLGAVAAGNRNIMEVLGWLGPLALAAYFLLTVVWVTLGNIFFPLTTFLEWLINGIFWLLAQILRLLLAGRAEILEDEADVGSIEEDIPQFLELFEPLTPIFYNRLVIISLALIILLVVAYSLNRLYQPARLARQSDELARSGGDSGDGARQPGLGQRLLQKLGFWQQWRAALSVRRVYRQMSLAAAGYGYPRGESETAYEYLNTLHKVWPDATAETQLITHAYVRVRYGEAPETKAELDEIKGAWDKLTKTKPANYVD